MINVKFSKKDEIIFLISVSFFWFAQYVYIPYQTPYLTMIQTSTSFIGIIIGTYVRSEMVLRLLVGLLEDYKNKHKMIMLIPALAAYCLISFQLISNIYCAYLMLSAAPASRLSAQSSLV